MRRTPDPSTAGASAASGRSRLLGPETLPLQLGCGCLAAPLAILVGWMVVGVVAGWFLMVFLLGIGTDLLFFKSVPANLAVLAALLVVAALLHFYSPRIYARRVASIMLRRARDTRELEVAASSDVTDEGARQGASLRTTVTDGDPAFTMYDHTAVDLIDSAAEEFVRDRLRNLRGKIFLSGVMGGLASWFLLELVTMWQASGPPDPTAFRVLIAITLFPAAIVLLLYRIRLGVGVGTALFAGLSIAGWKFGAVYNGWIAAPGTSGAGLMPFYLPPAAYVVTVLVAGVAALSRGRAAGHAALVGRRLLVLRVFGMDRNTESLFGIIVRRWPLLGPLVTMVDPSYGSLVFARSRLLLLVPVALMLLRGLGLPLATSLLHGALFGSLFYVTALPVMLAARLWQLNSSTGRDIAAVQPRLDLETRSLFRQRYPAIRITCFDDLWKATLGQLVGWADCVLMDLRGFDHTRKGCEYEIGYLIDRCSLGRIAFLLDASTDQDLFRATVIEQWRNRSAESPNAEVARPVVHCYRCTSTGRGMRGEVYAILALLGELLTSGVQREVASDRTPDSSVPVRDAAADTVTRGVQHAVWASWGLVVTAIAVGAVGKMWGVFWFSLLLLLLTSRMRATLIRHGDLKRVFTGIWAVAFWVLVAMWTASTFGAGTVPLTLIIGFAFTAATKIAKRRRGPGRDGSADRVRDPGTGESRAAMPDDGDPGT